MSDWWNWPPFGLPNKTKQIELLAALRELTTHHQRHCPQYRAILESQAVKTIEFGDLSEIPFLPVRLFKHLDLMSMERSSIFKTLSSSGTAGQQVSKIFLDKETATAQARALVKILQDFIGVQRLPLLIIDHPAVMSDRRTLSARGAGILGISSFGRDHTYALRDSDMSLDLEAIKGFLERHRGAPVLVFGFTFMVWKHFVQALRDLAVEVQLDQAILLHSGGWKKLEEQAVDNQTFKTTLTELTGINRVHNFYGMAEQVGSIFMECEQGVLHAPAFADVLIRRPFDWNVLPKGQAGLIQVLSILPRSYPGHSLLTEDVGMVLDEDQCLCGRLGKTIRVLGRIQQTEIRGCSDTHASSVN